MDAQKEPQQVETNLRFANVGRDHAGNFYAVFEPINWETREIIHDKPIVETGSKSIREALAHLASIEEIDPPFVHYMHNQMASALNVITRLEWHRSGKLMETFGLKVVYRPDGPPQATATRLPKPTPLF